MSLPTPNTRKEQYLNAIATGNAGGLPTPITREEEYLDAIAKSGGGSGEGDMKKSVYDSDLAVANAGGIGAFVSDSEKDIYAVMGEMGAKNLIPYPYKKLSTKVRGITWSDNGDGGIVGNGTGESASSQPYCEINGNQSNNEKDILLKAGKWYVLTCKRTSEYAIGADIYFLDPQTLLQTQITYDCIYDDRVQLQRTSNNIYMKYEGVQYNKAAFKLPQDMYAQMQVRYEKGTNVSVTNDIQYPMLRLASDTDDTYQPYAKTNKQLTDEIANKVDKVEGKGLSTNDYSDTEKGKVADNTGAIEAIVNEYGAKNLVDIPDTTMTSSGYVVNGAPIYLPAGSYILTFDFNGASSASQFVIQDTNGVDLANETFTVASGTNEVSFTLARDGVSMIYFSNAVGDYSKFMIRDARITDPTYVPYAMTNRELTENAPIRIEKHYSNVTIPSSGYLIIDAFAQFTPPLNSYFLLGMYLGGGTWDYTKSLVLSRGSNGNDIYLFGEPQTIVDINVCYILIKTLNNVNA